MTPSKLNHLIGYLKDHGSQSIDYSTLQDHLDHHVINDIGYAAYGNQSGHRFVLGGPICSREHMVEFIQSLVGALGNPAFVQIDKKTAELLHDQFGYKITRLGIETFLPIQDYSLYDDSKKSRLRASVRRGRERARVLELDQSALMDRFAIDETDLGELSMQWIDVKTNKRPLRFLLRKATYSDEPYVRKFYSIDDDNNVLGFIFFDPIFKNGDIIGYCPSVIRTKPGAPMGHAAYILFEALAEFKEENRKIISLGLSPVTPSRSAFRHDLMTFYGLKFLYEYGNRMYNFSGMSYYKKQFKGSSVDSYCATRKTFSAFESLAIARYVGFV